MAKKKTRCEKIEEEDVMVRKELEKLQSVYHQNMLSIKASEELKNILNNQISPLIKTSLGYEISSSSSWLENKEYTKLIK